MTAQLESLADAFLEIKTKKEMVDFLEGMLTPKELLELPTRLEIVKMLKSGVAQHTIAEELGVGIATVTRGSKELQKGRFKNV
ncbi:MAG: YerC/YecD family TrpR-related protein [Candidatus Levyibacteriota bacterium]